MKKIATPLINFYLYTILLIVTPFLMLQNYLQTAIGTASRAALDLGFVKIPYTIIIAIIALAVVVFLSIKHITKRRLLVIGIVILFFAIGQFTSDYYFGHHFYDLQHNWHYIAYGLFAFIAFRRFSLKQRPTHKMLFTIFIMALAISIFDEFIQVYISNRIFDLSDVAKDLWGCMAGTIFVFFCLENGKGFPNYTFKQKKLKAYFTNPFSLLALEIIFAYLMLFVASQITEQKYGWHVAFITLASFIIVFLLIHLNRNRIIRWAIRGSLLLLIGLVLFAAFFKTPHIKQVKPGHINYNGIPLLYFDYMIFPDGGFRTVDKKTSFGSRDKQKIESLDPDILLIGKGTKGQGGKGWSDNEVTEMMYNPKSNKVYQIIKLPNKQACEAYNRLSKQNKRILFIIHNQ